MKKAIFLFFCIYFLSGLNGIPKTAEIHIKLNNIKAKKGGKIIVNLYKGKNNWLKKNKQLVVKKVLVSLLNNNTIVLKNISYANNYAISVYHDENNNNKLDFSWFPPKPKEGSGVSNNKPGFLGPPKFKNAKFKLNSLKLKLNIKLSY